MEGEPKQGFYDICITYGLDDAALLAVAALAKVPSETVENMFTGDLVAKHDAESALVIMSQLTGLSLTLENTTVSLLSEASESEAPHAN